MEAISDSFILNWMAKVVGIVAVGMAKVKTTILMRLAGALTANIISQMIHGKITFLAKTLTPIDKLMVILLVKRTIPIENKASPPATLPRTINVFSSSTGICQPARAITKPSSALMTNGFLNVLISR